MQYKSWKSTFNPIQMSGNKAIQLLPLLKTILIERATEKEKSKKKRKCVKNRRDLPKAGIFRDYMKYANEIDYEYRWRGYVFLLGFWIYKRCDDVQSPLPTVIPVIFHKFEPHTRNKKKYISISRQCVVCNCSTSLQLPFITYMGDIISVIIIIIVIMFQFVYI